MVFQLPLRWRGCWCHWLTWKLISGLLWSWDDKIHLGDSQTGSRLSWNQRFYIKPVGDRVQTFPFKAFQGILMGFHSWETLISTVLSSHRKGLLNAVSLTSLLFALYYRPIHSPTHSCGPREKSATRRGKFSSFHIHPWTSQASGATGGTTNNW